MKCLPVFVMLLGTVYNWPAVYVWPDTAPSPQKQTPCVVVLGASWCGPCQQLKGQLKVLKGEGKYIVEDWGVSRAAFFYVDIDKHPDTFRWMQDGTSSVPQVIRFEGNTITARHTGFMTRNQLEAFYRGK